MNAFYRAGRDTEVTTGALIFYHSMHLFGGAEDGIDRTGLNAKCATNTNLFVDNDHGFALMFTMFLIQWFGFAPQQIRQG